LTSEHSRRGLGSRDDHPSCGTIVPAEGVILERVLDATYPLSNGGLSRHAYGRLDAPQTRTVWGRGHWRRFARVGGGAVLASATQYDLTAILDQQPVRVCGFGSIFSEPIRNEKLGGCR